MADHVNNYRLTLRACIPYDSGLYVMFLFFISEAADLVDVNRLVQVSKLFLKQRACESLVKMVI